MTKDKKKKEQAAKKYMEEKTDKKTSKNESSQPISDDVKALQEQLEQITQEKEDLFQKLQRLSADYANFQKRSPKQIADSVAYEKKAILRSLLPSLDNFEHALKSSHASESVEDVVKGVRMIFEHLLDALKNQGLAKMDAEGEPFDPAMHEAMMQQSDEDQPDGIVLQVFQPGYLLGEQVLRPAKVIVNKITKPIEEEPQEAGEEEPRETEQPQNEPEDENGEP